MPAAFLPVDAFTLAAVAAELRAVTVGAYIQKIQQPSPTEIVLALYGRAGAQRILLSADPRTARVHLTTQRREVPQTPPGFCQVCRKYLDGATLAEVIQPRFDRLLLLRFHAPDNEIVTLVAELMGRNANLILTSGSSQETIRGVLRPGPVGSERLLRPGVSYHNPPGSEERVDPLTLSGPDDAIFRDLPADATRDEQQSWLQATFSGIGRFAAEEIVGRIAPTPHPPPSQAVGKVGKGPADANEGEQGAVSSNPPSLAREGGEPKRAGWVQGLPSAFCGLMDAVKAETFAPHILSESDGTTWGVWAFASLSLPANRAFARSDVSVALDTFFAGLAARNQEEGASENLARAIRREIAFREKERESALATLREAERADQYEQTGNNLIAQIGLTPRGADSVTVPDLYATGGEAVTIALDPKRTPQENAEAYFQRARKAREAGAYADGKIADLDDELARLNELAARLADSSDIDALQRDLSAIVGAEHAAVTKPDGNKPRPPRERPFGGHKIRTYTVEGFELLIGETAEANDYLTTRVAAPSDLWMHVRAAPGAHGILRTGNKPERVGDAVIRRAAQIVAARSGSAVKHASLVAVDVTQKRYVRKPRGAKPGMVTYERERVFDVLPSL